jgi:hypothetical protein
MSETGIEIIFIGIVGDFQQTIFYPECIAEVLANRITGNFNFPIL